MGRVVSRHGRRRISRGTCGPWCPFRSGANYLETCHRTRILVLPGADRRQGQSPNAMTVRPAATTTRPPPAAGAMKREGTAPICLEKILLPVAGLTASSTPDSVDTDQMARWVMMAGPGLEVGDVHFTLKRSPVTETAATLLSHDT